MLTATALLLQSFVVTVADWFSGYGLWITSAAGYLILMLIPSQVYVQKRNGIVLEDTARGFLEGRWKWNINVEGFDDVELEAV